MYIMSSLSQLGLEVLGHEGVSIILAKLLELAGALPKSRSELTEDLPIDEEAYKQYQTPLENIIKADIAGEVVDDFATIADEMDEYGTTMEDYIDEDAQSPEEGRPPPRRQEPEEQMGEEGPDEPEQMGEEGSDEPEQMGEEGSDQPDQPEGSKEPDLPQSPGLSSMFNMLRNIMGKDGMAGALKYLFDLMMHPATKRYAKQLLWYICNNPEAVADLFGVPLADVKALCGIVDEIESMIPAQAPVKADVETIPQRREEYKKDKVALAKREAVREARIKALPEYEARVYGEQAFPKPDFIPATDPRHPANKKKPVIKVIGEGFKKAPMRSPK